jgi:tripartite-type tricarboxylate transporter receptor subunit TctC
MKLPRRNFLHLAVGAAALPMASRIAWAQTYPARPVRIIVGVPAGGGVDLIARVMGEWLSERLGQPFLIENRPGAGTNIAAEAVMRAQERTATRFSWSLPQTRSMLPGTKSLVSISAATSRRSPALWSCPTSCW